MPIHIIVNDGKSVPVVYCDRCEQPIDDASDGKVGWRAIDISVPYFTHQGCTADHVAERRHHFVQKSMELQEFLGQLGAIAK